jgi:hypothetical protein
MLPLQRLVSCCMLVCCVLVCCMLVYYVTLFECVHLFTSRILCLYHRLGIDTKPTTTISELCVSQHHTLVFMRVLHANRRHTRNDFEYP